MKVSIILNGGCKTVCNVTTPIVCADGGYDKTEQRPYAVVGDFDSSVKDLDDGIIAVRHNPKKNQTDGELALQFAIERLHADEIDFYGVLGGREDHVLGNLALLALADDLGVKAVAREDGLDVFACHGKAEFEAKTGQLVSILPFGCDAVVTDTVGLEYPLDNLKLLALGTRGISNIALSNVSLTVTSGRVLVFHYHD